MLDAIPLIRGISYVITGKNNGAYLTDLQKPWRRVRSLAGLDDVRIHNLRHTFASNAVSAGLSLPIIGKLLRHTQKQTTARYTHLMDEPVRQAGTKTADSIGDALWGDGSTEKQRLQCKLLFLVSRIQ
ncbi:MAG: tyrosine-type recombinase/integrase [Pseudomonadota bacterium]